MHILSGGTTSNYNGDPPTFNNYKNTTKETPIMSHKKKTVLLRFARTMGATMLGLLAAWLSGPDGLSLVKDPVAQSFIVAVIVPTLVAANKAIRYGSEPGES